MRHACFLLLLCACSSLSTEEREQLAGHIRNAKYYYEGGHLDQAMGQIDRGLALEADNYTLRTMRGTIMLRQSSSSLGTDHRMLDQATEELQAVYDTRSPNRHEPALLLTWAMVQQKQGRRRLGEELRLRGQASRSADKADLEAKADAQRVEAVALLDEARSALKVLVERGELLRIAHNHLLQIAQDLGDDAAFGDAAKAYFAQCAKDQNAVRREIAQTVDPTYEAEQTRALRALEGEELAVRSLLAEHCYTRQRFDEALVQLNRVLELDPQRTVDYYNRGRTLLELKRNDDAKSDFRRFLAMPASETATEKRTLALRALEQ